MKKPSSKKLAKNLKLLRSSKNLSQESLAELMGVNRAQISRWESGKGNPTFKAL